MAVNPLGMNQGTQNFIRFEDDGGTVNTQVVDIRQGTIALTGGGTTVTVDHGTITLSNPTGTTVTVDHGTVTLSNPTGTTTQFNNGTVDLLKAGTITRVEGGSIVMTAGTVAAHAVTAATVTAGTLNLLDTVTTVSNLTNGSVRMTVGTLTVMPNIPGGTVGLVSSVTEVANLAKGTITRLEGGTLGVVSSVANLAAGTVTRLEQGSINVTAGTITSGSIAVTTGTVVGDVASAATDAGNPVKIGGLFNTTPPTLSDGQRGNLQMSARGALKVQLMDSGINSINLANDGADAIGTSSTANALKVLGRNTVYNGASWDRMKGDTGGVFVKGTVSQDPYPSVNIIAGGTTSAGTIGTLVAAPSAGTQMVITGFHILQVSGTAETVLSFGLQAAGNQVVARGNFAAGGGITENDTYPSAYGATGTALTWNILSGSGTISLKAKYYLR